MNSIETRKPITSSRKGTQTFGAQTFFLLRCVKHTFSPKNINKWKCPRNGSPCVQNGLLPYQNAYFFAYKLMVTSVSVKNHIFGKFFVLYFFTFSAPKKFVFVLLFGPFFQYFQYCSFAPVETSTSHVLGMYGHDLFVR